MNLWISICLSFFFSLSAVAKCDFKNHLSKIYSISGPVTMVLKEMRQLRNPKLRGVSIFHPISKDEFTGKFLPGGIFLSSESLNEFSGGVVFFDESRELSLRLTPLNSLQSVEILTRGLLPKETVQKVILELTKFMQGCDLEFKKVLSKVENLENKILASIKMPLKINFYMGEFRQGRPPEMIMANDGVVKWLRMKNKIQTYPSDLAYVNWSSKLISQMPKETLQVALKDSGSELKNQFVQTSKNVSFIFPGILIPGLGQLEGFLELLKLIQR